MKQEIKKINIYFVVVIVPSSIFFILVFVALVEERTQMNGGDVDQGCCLDIIKFFKKKLIGRLFS